MSLLTLQGERSALAGAVPWLLAGLLQVAAVVLIGRDRVGLGLCSHWTGGLVMWYADWRDRRGR